MADASASKGNGGGLLGAALGGAAGGMLGGLFGGDAPTRKQVNLDEGTENAIVGANAEANKSAGDIQKDLTRGVDDRGILDGSEPGMDSAIASKYKSALGEDMSRIKTGTELESRQKQVSNQDRAMKFNIARKNIGNQARARLMEAQVAEDTLRSRLLGNILGGLGENIGRGLGTGDIAFGGGSKSSDASSKDDKGKGK